MAAAVPALGGGVPGGALPGGGGGAAGGAAAGAGANFPTLPGGGGVGGALPDLSGLPRPGVPGLTGGVGGAAASGTPLTLPEGDDANGQGNGGGGAGIAGADVPAGGAQLGGPAANLRPPPPGGGGPGGGAARVGGGGGGGGGPPGGGAMGAGGGPGGMGGAGPPGMGAGAGGATAAAAGTLPSTGEPCTFFEPPASVGQTGQNLSGIHIYGCVSVVGGWVCGPDQVDRPVPLPSCTIPNLSPNCSTAAYQIPPAAPGALGTTLVGCTTTSNDTDTLMCRANPVSSQNPPTAAGEMIPCLTVKLPKGGSSTGNPSHPEGHPTDEHPEADGNGGTSDAENGHHTTGKAALLAAGLLWLVVPLLFPGSSY